MQAGDILVIIYGAELPFILQPLDNKEPKQAPFCRLSVAQHNSGFTPKLEHIVFYRHNIAVMLTWDGRGPENHRGQNRSAETLKMLERYISNSLRNG
jgi:hypothetical protein